MKKEVRRELETGKATLKYSAGQDNMTNHMRVSLGLLLGQLRCISYRIDSETPNDDISCLNAYGLDVNDSARSRLGLVKDRALMEV